MQGQEIELLGRADTNAVVAPRLKRVLVRFIQDPALAARAYTSRKLDLLRIDNPILYDALVETAPNGERKVRGQGEFISHKFARLRTLIVNGPALAKRGLSNEQIGVIRKALSFQIDRQKIAKVAPGNATPAYAAFPPVEQTMGARLRPQHVELSRTPQVQLTLLVNNDPYSDLIASQLPKQIGNISLSYRAVDFSAIIASFQKKENDVIGLSLDATINTPNFWLSFWLPGSALTLFGKPLKSVAGLDVAEPKDLSAAAKIIQEQGNWIPLYTDEGMIVKSTGIDGLRLTRSGQESLENIGHRK